METKSESPFLELPALKVKQPLSEFYIITIKAQDLLSISFSEPLQYIDENGNLKGSQRPPDEKRLKEIGKYIDSVEMAFPNSIILAANYTSQGQISTDTTERWNIVEDINCGICNIRIPTDKKLAAVIDGQHRLNAFKYVGNLERFSNLQLVCSIYFDLPNSYQAFLFATINSNQKRVDRSLALEQFGYNVGEEPEKVWTPEKFAVFLSRKLNIDSINSPFYKHIKVAPLNPENLFRDGVGNSWVISTATVVDGILSLITSNPKRDRIEMQQKSIFTGRNRDMLSKQIDYSPLRNTFISGQDQTIYDTIINYFNSVSKFLWQDAPENSYITKTVGIQACFDILKLFLQKNSTEPTEINFDNYFSTIVHVDFSDKFYQASGIGRSRIKNTLGLAFNLVSRARIKKDNLYYYDTILSSQSNIDLPTDKWPWEESAEEAVANTLKKAVWNYKAKKVSLYIENYESATVFDSYESFFDKLVEIAENTFNDNLPGDHEIADEQREKFDADNLVETYLVDYEFDLKKLGWWK